jgi:hypothetical protein
MRTQDEHAACLGMHQHGAHKRTTSTVDLFGELTSYFLLLTLSELPLDDPKRNPWVMHVLKTGPAIFSVSNDGRPQGMTSPRLLKRCSPFISAC